VLLQEPPIRRVPVDIAFIDVNPVLLQKTSGVAAGRSRGLPVEKGFGHKEIVADDDDDGGVTKIPKITKNEHSSRCASL
jgi:hypothetical protein